MIWEYANGYDDSPVQSGQTDQKDISNETITGFDITDRKQPGFIFCPLAKRWVCVSEK